MYEIPTSIDLNGRKFQIRNDGDYRVVLDCFSALNDVELEASERLIAALIIFYEDLSSMEDLKVFEDNVEEAVYKMFRFFGCGKEPDAKNGPNYKVVDWDNDMQLIVSGINKIIGKEVRFEPYMHWWTFMAHYTAIGKGPFTSIVQIRNKILKGKKLEKDEQEFRRDNPEYFTWNSKSTSAREADELAREIWNSGG